MAENEWNFQFCKTSAIVVVVEQHGIHVEPFAQIERTRAFEHPPKYLCTQTL